MVAGACTADPTPSTTSTPAPSTASTTSTTASGPPTTVEESPLDTRMEWVADVLTAGTIEPAEYEANFTTEFTDNVPYEEFNAVVGQISATGETWSVGEFEERDGLNGTALIEGDEGVTVRADMTLELVVPYRISGLLIQPSEPPALENPPQTYAEAGERLSDHGTVEAAVFAVEGGACTPVFETGSSGPVPVGSAIKLYVLAAVADAVETGELGWDTEIPIQDELKSIPTGTLQDEEAGTIYSVRQFAEAMISFSDNTATDHLIDLVGRSAVEEALGAYGMTDPSLNIPFMDTLDLAALKVGPASGLATQWLEADQEGRRALLEQVSDITPSDIPVAEFTEPVLPDQIEWFATTADMCRVLAALYAKGEPLTQILTINPGIPDEGGNFETVAFKGGSEPGLISMNWLVEMGDGRRFVLSSSVLNPESTVDELEVTLLLGAMRDLIAAEPG